MKGMNVDNGAMTKSYGFDPQHALDLLKRGPQPGQQP
jgi:hypothetical protein